MAGGHDRRSFLRELLRGASRAAGEISQLRDSTADSVEQPFGPGLLGDVPGTTRAPVPAIAAWRLASTDDLRALCEQVDREAWADEVSALARPSLRLTPGGTGSSRLGGSPDAPTSFAWPEWEGEQLAFLGQIQLDDLPGGPLPSTGLLLFFFALDRAPPGLRSADAGACRVVYVGGGTTERVERPSLLPETPVTATVELMLPDEPASLAIDGWQFEAWTELRERLAALQGVELEETATDYHALHRLLGYPDTFAGGMELDAQLVSHGIDLDDEPFAHPRSDELAPGAAGWRLLLQLSSDDELGVAFGYLERLFVWIRDDDLRAARFDRVRAFVR